MRWRCGRTSVRYDSFQDANGMRSAEALTLHLLRHGSWKSIRRLAYSLVQNVRVEPGIQGSCSDSDTWRTTAVAGGTLGPMFADASTIKVLHGADHDTL